MRGRCKMQHAMGFCRYFLFPEEVMQHGTDDERLSSFPPCHLSALPHHLAPTFLADAQGAGAISAAQVVNVRVGVEH